jgi:hypothetical protein
VNEGDFLNVTLTRPTPDLGDVDELVERLWRDLINRRGRSSEGFSAINRADLTDAIIALRAALDKKD